MHEFDWKPGVMFQPHTASYRPDALTAKRPTKPSVGIIGNVIYDVQFDVVIAFGDILMYCYLCHAASEAHQHGAGMEHSCWSSVGHSDAHLGSDGLVRGAFRRRKTLHF